MLKQILKFNTCVILLLFKINLIHSHAILEYSEPGRRAILYRSPAKIILTFNEKIEENFAKIKIMDNTDKLILSKSNAQNLENDQNSIFISIPKLSSGVYFIQYEVISVDGHKVKGRYKFTINKN